MGARTIEGRNAHMLNMDVAVTEPVSRKTYIARPKSVNPLPMLDINCPATRMVNFFIDLFFSVIPIICVSLL
ncbi:hypothetical protein SDC9_78446 [bioreactor metagenome]|uniref:Uncharacterized protein n=1 Tax=bioreactor metagenome TaxID=1076179 RepID=A0A644YU87_9ZZZZ